MIRSLCYFLAARLGAYATGLEVYATFSIPRGSFDPKKNPYQNLPPGNICSTVDSSFSKIADVEC